jgi:hypothetical protein
MKKAPTTIAARLALLIAAQSATAQYLLLVLEFKT